ncbi:MarR family transcriptional regulator, partial [Acidovorax cavernicola]
MATNTKDKTIELNLEALAYIYSRVPFQIQRIDQIASAFFAAQQDSSALLTAAQLQMLWLLDKRKPLMQTDLSRLAGADKATTGFIIGNLLKRQLVHREADAQDRRRKLVSITEDGKAALRAARQQLKQANDKLLAPLKPAEREKLVQCLKTLALRGQAEDVEPFMLEATLWLTRRCLQAADGQLTKEAGLFGLTLRQFCTLYVVLCHPGIGEPLIRRLLGYEVSNAALVIGLLRDKGFVEVVPGSSAARKRYSATTLGRDVLVTVEPKLSKIEDSFVAVLHAADTRTLQNLLSILISVHSDKVKAHLDAFVDAMQLPSWPVPSQANYASTNAD